MKEAIYRVSETGNFKEITQPEDGGLVVIHTHIGSDFAENIAKGIYPIQGHFKPLSHDYVKRHKVVNGDPSKNQAENITYVYSSAKRPRSCKRQPLFERQIVK